MNFSLQQIFNYIEESRLVMTWIDALDIAFVASFLSVFLVWLQRRASRSILFAIVPLLITFVAAKTLKMHLTSMIFQFGLIALSIIVVVIFQEDFRRTFEALATWRPWGKNKLFSPGKLPDLLVECLFSFAETKTGALIVLQGRQSIEPFVRAGILVRGRISLPLLQSIFDHHSPGHDGGVTIINGVIDQLGVHLPLSRNDTGRLGTRHAAALGLAEKSDALILVVSEETGTISIATNGRIEAATTGGAIKNIIRTHFRKLDPMPLHRSFFTVPWFRLSGATVLSICLWLLFARPTQVVQRSGELPIVYRNLPNGWEARPPQPAKVRVTLIGPEGPSIRLDMSGMAASVDLKGVVQGKQRLALERVNFSLPKGVRIKTIEPSEVTVDAYTTHDHSVPVKISWAGSPERIPSSAKFQVQPATVSVRLPSSTNAPENFETEPVNMSELIAAGKVRVKLRFPSEFPYSEISTSTVEISISLPKSH